MSRAGALQPPVLLEEVDSRALPSLRHSPELSLQIHKVLPGQHQARAGVDDQGLAVLEVGRPEPPFGELGKEPEPVRGWGGSGGPSPQGQGTLCPLCGAQILKANGQSQNQPP